MSDTRALDIRKHMSDPRIRRIYSRMKARYTEARMIARGMDHIERDLINALVIGETEDCKMPIVTAAILLHDIGFLYDPRSDRHNVLGAEKCREWLEGWTGEEQAEIADCIFRHKGVNEHWKTSPETIEQKIICDADLLEKVGYIGAVQSLRVFVEFGASFAPEFSTLSALANVLTKLTTVQFYTRKGRELAEERGGVAVRVDIMQKALREESFYHAALEGLASL
jgi:HD superfamily phosphodiesterase